MIIVADDIEKGGNFIAEDRGIRSNKKISNMLTGIRIPLYK